MKGMEKLTRPTACDYDRARCQFQLERSGLAPPHLRFAARLLLRRFALGRSLPWLFAARLGLPRLLLARLNLPRLLAPRFDLPRLFLPRLNLSRLFAAWLHLPGLLAPRFDLPRLVARRDDRGPTSVVRPIRVFRMLRVFWVLRVLRVLRMVAPSLTAIVVPIVARAVGLSRLPRLAGLTRPLAAIGRRNN